MIDTKVKLKVPDELINKMLYLWSAYGLNRMFWRLEIGYDSASAMGYHEQWKEDELIKDGWYISSKSGEFAYFTNDEFKEILPDMVNGAR